MTHVETQRECKSDLRPGDRFNLLTVLIRVAPLPKSSARRYSVECDCGTIKDLDASDIRKAYSCGCKARELISLARKKHGYCGTRTYSCWDSMYQRCTNPNHKSFAMYGGRGIAICERWLVFENFLADMGEKPPRTAIDRIDVNGNYEPGNCRWATYQDSANNKRNNRTIEFKGRTQTLSQWSREIGIARDSLARRISSGWRLDKAFTQPARRQRNSRRISAQLPVAQFRRGEA